MSTIIMSACWDLQGMSPAQKLVLMSLAHLSNDEGVCIPKMKSLAARSSLSVRATQEALAELEKAKLISRDFRHNKSTVYTVTPPAVACAPSKGDA